MTLATHECDSQVSFVSFFVKAKVRFHSNYTYLADM